MSQFPEGQPAYAAPQQPQKGWFGRNWWWFIPLIVLTPFICCCSSCAGCSYWALQQVDKLPPYKDTIAYVETNAEVEAELGSPIEVAGLIDTVSSGGNFDIEQSGTTATMNAAIPISGPKGSGTLYIEASDSGTGVWTYTRREIVIDGSGKTIDLMPAGSKTPDPAPDADTNTGDNE